MDSLNQAVIPPSSLSSSIWHCGDDSADDGLTMTAPAPVTLIVVAIP